MKDLPVENKIKLLKYTNIFSKLKDEELHVIADNSETIELKENDIVYRDGTSAQELYIIISGEILIIKTVEENQRIDLARFLPGECFGELDLFNDIIHKTSAISLAKSELLIFPKKGKILKDVFKEHSKNSAQILYKFIALIANRIRSTNKLISEKTPWVEDLRKQLYRDKLTGLYNKTYLDEELSGLLEKNDCSLSLLVIKPDNFKDINDKYGHEAGDNALKFMSEKIAELLNDNMIAVRYKGDEFTVILQNTDLDSAMITAEVIRSSILDSNIKNILKGNDFYIKVSIGISTTEINSSKAKELIESAYKNMFTARNSGGNSVIFNN
jgi:diguanylate cyclase